MTWFPDSKEYASCWKNSGYWNMMQIMRFANKKNPVITMKAAPEAYAESLSFYTALH